MAYDEPDGQREAHEDNAANHSGGDNDLEPKEEESWESHERIDGYRKTHEEDILTQSVERHDIKSGKKSTGKALMPQKKHTMKGYPYPATTGDENIKR